MKNLVILHLESISRQRLAAFADVLPHTTRLLREALSFDNFFSSATSTLMVVGYLFHGNDFEYDTAPVFEGMLPERNNAHLFTILQERGYRSELICLSGFQHIRQVKLRSWSSDLPPLWATNDFPTLIARFDALTDAPPFAMYVWDLITHIEHSLALAPHAHGLTDQIRRACAVADDTVGKMREILERKGLLDNTTIVLYGDHGDDFWTHGFKGGMIHGTEPYTGMIWAPLAIRDPGLAPGTIDRIASTVDIAPTCLALLDIEAPYAFPYSGTDLLHGETEFAYSQNLMLNQVAAPVSSVGKAFSITDKTHTLLAGPRGLELYAYRLDPGNHCNLLQFFSLGASGQLILQDPPGASPHFLACWRDNPQSVQSLSDDFQRLRTALAARLEAKRAYLVEHGVDLTHALGQSSVDTINADARDAFFGRPPTVAAPAAMPTLEFSYKLR